MLVELESDGGSEVELVEELVLVLVEEVEVLLVLVLLVLLVDSVLVVEVSSEGAAVELVELVGIVVLSAGASVVVLELEAEEYPPPLLLANRLRRPADRFKRRPLRRLRRAERWPPRARCLVRAKR